MVRYLAIVISAVLAAAPAIAQNLERVGSDDRLDLATWNVEWFGHASNGPSNEETQLQNVAHIILESGIEVWALQEVATDQVFDDLLAVLGDDWRGALATEHSGQRVGFVFDTRVVQQRGSARHILTQFEEAFGFRPPLEMEIDAILPPKLSDSDFRRYGIG